MRRSYYDDFENKGLTDQTIQVVRPVWMRPDHNFEEPQNALGNAT